MVLLVSPGHTWQKDVRFYTVRDLEHQVVQGNSRNTIQPPTKRHHRTLGTISPVMKNTRLCQAAPMSKGTTTKSTQSAGKLLNLRRFYAKIDSK
jgi:hypothetical protein